MLAEHARLDLRVPAFDLLFTRRDIGIQLADVRFDLGNGLIHRVNVSFQLLKQIMLFLYGRFQLAAVFLQLIKVRAELFDLRLQLALTLGIIFSEGIACCGIGGRLLHG